MLCHLQQFLFFFFFNDTATTEIYTLSLHDALPICCWPDAPKKSRRRCRGPSGNTSARRRASRCKCGRPANPRESRRPRRRDRKSTRLNSSHSQISYAVFCLKKKTKNAYQHTDVG